MSCSAKMRKLSVRIDADLKAAFKDTLRGIGVNLTCAMGSFTFHIVLEGDIPFSPVDASFEADGKTAVAPLAGMQWCEWSIRVGGNGWFYSSANIKIPEDVAGEMESVLKGLVTNFSQAVRPLALQMTALGGMPFAAGIPRKAR